VSASLDQFRKRPSVDVRRSEVVVTAGFAEVEDRHEVSMPHLPRDACLAYEALPVDLVAGEEALQNLERDDFVVRGPDSGENDADRALAEHGLEPVRTERLAQSQVGSTGDALHGRSVREPICRADRRRPVPGRAGTRAMTAGRGRIAVGLVIFARWNPIGALAGGLLFGLMEALNFQAQAVGITLSPFFLGMLPYLFTIAAVVFAAAVGGRRLGAPAALGLPYRREAR
jgi:hypothetical protein